MNLHGFKIHNDDDEVRCERCKKMVKANDTDLYPYGQFNLATMCDPCITEYTAGIIDCERENCDNTASIPETGYRIGETICVQCWHDDRQTGLARKDQYER